MFNLSCQQLQTSPEYGQGMNPISRLAQIQQAKKEKEPEYSMVTERGLPRRREFVMQVSQLQIKHDFSAIAFHLFSYLICEHGILSGTGDSVRPVCRRYGT